MSKKEVAMKEDGEWNTMSPEETMIMALVTSLESATKTDDGNSNNKKKKNKKRKDKSKNDNSSDDKKEDDAEKKKKYDSKIPAWKLIAPSSSDPKTKEVDGKTYHFCRKCRKGEGMWALHKESEHRDDFKNKKKGGNDNKKDTKKEVTFSTDTKTVDGGPAVQVSKSLLKNAKAYLAQYQDFREGGSQPGR